MLRIVQRREFIGNGLRDIANKISLLCPAGISRSANLASGKLESKLEQAVISVKVITR